MSIQQRLEQDVVACLKAGERDLVTGLRMALAAIKNKRIECQRELSEDEVVRVLQRELKQLEETLSFVKARNIANEVALLEQRRTKLTAYLPTALNPAELRALVVNLRAEQPTLDKGGLIKAAVAAAGTRAPGGEVAKLVNEVWEGA